MATFDVSVLTRGRRKNSKFGLLSASARGDCIIEILQVILETLLADTRLMLWKHWSNCIIASIICRCMTVINEPRISASIDAELTHFVHCTPLKYVSQTLASLWCVCLWNTPQHDSMSASVMTFNNNSPACVCVFVPACRLCVLLLGSCDSRGGRLRSVSLVRRITYIC